MLMQSDLATAVTFNIHIYSCFYMPNTLQNSLTSHKLAWRPVMGKNPNPVKGLTQCWQKEHLFCPLLQQRCLKQIHNFICAHAYSNFKTCCTRCDVNYLICTFMVLFDVFLSLTAIGYYLLSLQGKEQLGCSAKFSLFGFCITEDRKYVWIDHTVNPNKLAKLKIIEAIKFLTLQKPTL